MNRTIATCAVCKGRQEVYTRVILKTYKCLNCIRAEVVQASREKPAAAMKTEGDNHDATNTE